MRNRYEQKPYPFAVSFGAFDSINMDDVLNNPVKVLVRLETNKSLRVSLYVNEKMNSINKNVVSEAKYLKRSSFNYFSGEHSETYHLKVSKKQSGEELMRLVQQHIDSILPDTENGLDVTLHIHNEVVKYF
jgi:hypothetical protein